MRLRFKEIRPLGKGPRAAGSQHSPRSLCKSLEAAFIPSLQNCSSWGTTSIYPSGLHASRERHGLFEHSGECRPSLEVIWNENTHPPHSTAPWALVTASLVPFTCLLLLVSCIYSSGYPGFSQAFFHQQACGLLIAERF